MNTIRTGKQTNGETTEKGSDELWDYLSRNDQTKTIVETETEQTTNRVRAARGPDFGASFDKLDWGGAEWREKITKAVGTTTAPGGAGDVGKMVMKPHFFDPAKDLIDWAYYQSSDVLKPSVWLRDYDNFHPTVSSHLSRTDSDIEMLID